MHVKEVCPKKLILIYLVSYRLYTLVFAHSLICHAKCSTFSFDCEFFKRRTFFMTNKYDQGSTIECNWKDLADFLNYESGGNFILPYIIYLRYGVGVYRFHLTPRYRNALVQILLDNFIISKWNIRANCEFGTLDLSLHDECIHEL